MSTKNNEPINFCADIDMLYVKYLPLLQKHSIIKGRFDEDLFGELTIAFVQCTKKFRFNSADFTKAFFLKQQEHKNQNEKGVN